MATIKSITASYGRTFNLGNFESMRLDLALTKDLEPGDNAREEIGKSVHSLHVALLQEKDKLLKLKGGD